MLNEKSKAQVEKLLLECWMESEEADLLSIHCLAWITCVKIREFNFQTYSAFLDYVKSFYNVKETNCLKYCKAQQIPIFY
jgi:hypothetical protein